MFQTITSKRLSESYYKKVLPNGLTVLVYPMPDKNGIHAMLSTKFGSVNRDFVLNGRHVSVPAGVAHFLEHKLFENEAEDAFALFAQTGATANAYTSFERTCYLFSATINLEESLRILIRFVTQPMFTKETIAKEQGIIGQEIKMYDDDADWILMNMMFKNLYQAHPLREDIAGSVESIAEITPQLLYDCYNAFYRPANMVLTVAGNIDPKTVELICEEEYAGIEAPPEAVECIEAEEPAAIANKWSERVMSVSDQMFGFAYKEMTFAKENRLRKELTLRILLDLLAGETSDLYRELYDAGLANSTFDASALSGEDYLCISFSGESKDPDRVVAAIRQAIDRLRRDGVDPDRFLECKRALLGAELCSFDSVEAVAGKLTLSHMKGYAVFDTMETIETITQADLETIAAELFQERNSTVARIVPAQ